MLICSRALLSQNLSYSWANHPTGIGTTINDHRAFCVDSCGNVFVGGMFDGTVDFDPSPAVFSLSAQPYQFNAYVAKYDPTGKFLWVKRFEGQQWGNMHTLKLDRSGNIGFSATFNYTADIDPSPAVVAIGTPSIIGQYAYVKLDPGGNLLFGFNLGAGNPGGSSLVFDANDDLVISGCFNYNLDLDVGLGTTSVSSTNGSTDFFICKYSSSGNFMWGFKIGGAGSDRVRTPTTIDNSGNLILVGDFAGVVDFDPSPSSATLSASSGSAFMMKLSPTGNLIWVQNIGMLPPSYLYSACTDFSNNIFVTGQFSNTVDFDPSPLTYTLASNGSTDCFVAKYSSTGALQWVKQLGGALTDNGGGIKVDINSNVLICGTFRQAVDFDPGPSANVLTATSNGDAFLLQLDNGGNFMAVYQFASQTSTGTVYGIDVEYHRSGSIYLLGEFNSPADLDPGSPVITLNPTCPYEGFVVKLTPCTDAPAWNCDQIHRCAGSSATLVANGGSNLNWYISGSPTTISSGSMFITPTLSPGSYTYFAEAPTCTVSNNRAIFTLTVSPVPTVVINPAGGVVCKGDKVAIYATGANNYYWNNSAFPMSPSFTAIVTSNTVFSVLGTSTVSSCSAQKTVNITIDICQGTVSELKRELTNIFPNPFRESFSIESQIPLNIEVYDCVGMRIMLVAIKAGITSISTTEWSSGIYFLKVVADTSSSSYKMIKM